MTPQDVRFLKSLKISFDDQEVRDFSRRRIAFRIEGWQSPCFACPPSPAVSTRMILQNWRVRSPRWLPLGKRPPRRDCLVSLTQAIAFPAMWPERSMPA